MGVNEILTALRFTEKAFTGDAPKSSTASDERARKWTSFLNDMTQSSLTAMYFEVRNYRKAGFLGRDVGN